MTTTVGLAIISWQRPAISKCLEAVQVGEGQKHLDRANQAYDEGAMELALREFRAAHQLCRSAMALYGMAHSEAALGQESAAARDFELFLRDADDAEADIRQHAEDSLGTLSTRLMRVEVAGAIAGATLLVDGQKADGWVAGDAIYLTPGSHALRVQGGPAGQFERVLTSTMGGHLRVDVPKLVPLRPSPIQPAEASPRRRWWLWGGIAGLLVAGAVAGYVVIRPDRPPCPTLCP